MSDTDYEVIFVEYLALMRLNGNLNAKLEKVKEFLRCECCDSIEPWHCHAAKILLAELEQP